MVGADSKSPWYPWSWSSSGERIGFRALGKLPTDGACWGDGGGYKRNVALKIICTVIFFYVGDLGYQQFVMTKTQKFDVLGVPHPGLKFNSSNNVFTAFKGQ